MSADAIVIVRPFQTSDQSALLELVRELQAHERLIEPLMKPEGDIGTDYIAALHSKIDAHGGALLVAEDNQTLIGYAALFLNVPSEDDDEVAYTYAYVSDVAVTAQRRGEGLGRRLIAECETLARKSGAERLRISVLSENHGARKLYLSTGFSERVTEMEKPLN